MTGPLGADRALAAELIRRAELDQQVRAQPAKSPADFDRWRAVDADNLRWLRTVVADGEWPGRSRVGRGAAAAAWLLAQHADRDLRFQVTCLRLMRDALPAGEVELWQVAYLTDRVFSSAGRPQLFGTQHAADGSGPLPTVARPLLGVEQLTAGLPADLTTLWRGDDHDLETGEPVSGVGAAASVEGVGATALVGGVDATA